MFERPENCSDIVFVLAFVNFKALISLSEIESFDLQLLLTFAIEITLVWFVCLIEDKVVLSALWSCAFNSKSLVFESCLLTLDSKGYLVSRNFLRI